MRLIVRKKIALILVFVTAFSGMMFVGTDASYAASRPAKVTGLKVSSKTTETINLQWSKAKRAKKYQLAYRVAGGSWKYKTIKARSYKITKLKGYTRYYFRVRAVNGKRKGKWSATNNIYTNPINPKYDYLPQIDGLRVTRTGPGSIGVAWDIAGAVSNEEEKETDEASLPEVEENKSATTEESIEAVEAADAAVNSAEETTTEKTVSDSTLPSAEIKSETDGGQTTVTPETDTEISAGDSPLVSKQDVEVPATDNAQASAETETDSVQTSAESGADVKISTEEATAESFADYKFRVQIRTGSGGWKTVASALANSSNNYTIRDLEMGTEYGIRVVAIDDVTWRNYTVVKNDGYSEELKHRTNTIEGLSVKKSYTTRNEIYKGKRSLNVKGLMLHSVGANIQSAERWYNIFNRKGYDRAAVHAFIDGSDGEVWQTMPWGQRAGHAGWKANDSYIGVEMCESKYIDYNSGTNFTIASKYRSSAKSSATKTYWTSVRLFAYLCDRYNLNPLKEGTIYSHNEWRIKTGSGHWDPEHYWKGLGTGFTMKQFRKDVKSVLDKSITYY